MVRKGGRIHFILMMRDQSPGFSRLSWSYFVVVFVVFYKANECVWQKQASAHHLYQSDFTLPASLPPSLSLDGKCVFLTSLLLLCQTRDLSRPQHLPAQRHGDHHPLQPANRKQQLGHGQRPGSSLQYDTFRYIN